MIRVEQMQPVIEAALASQAKRVIFDVTSLAFIDSLGIAMLSIFNSW